MVRTRKAKQNKTVDMIGIKKKIGPNTQLIVGPFI